MTNRERAIEFNKSIVAELGVQPPAKGADMMWQEWCKRQAAELDAAEKRGELKGRSAGRVEECASIRALLGMLTGEPGCPEVVLKFYDALTQRLAQLRAESEET